MKSIVLLMGLLVSFVGFSQPGRGSQQMTGRFYGRVVDVSNKGIEAASVILVTQKRDSITKETSEVIVGGMLTAPNGDFSIENLPVMGRYKLKVTGIGYKEYEQDLKFEIDRKDPNGMLYALDRDLGNIQLVIDEKLLAGVTVTGTRPGLTMGIDRKIFNVDKNIVSAGGTAVDIMKNVPSVNVDLDGNVTLRNNAPQIFVDGRPTNLELDQIPADAIESIEIITNPSAKFDASGGTSGILNIVLKKQRRVGYAGNIRANVDSRAKFGGGGDINVRQGKVNFFAAGNYNQRKSLSEGTTDLTTLGTRTEKFTQVDDNVWEGRHAFGRAGFDYFINNRNTFSLTGSMMDGRMEPGTVSIRTTARPDSTYRTDRITTGYREFRNKGVMASFKHNFPKAGNEWTADITYNKGENESDNRLNDKNYAQQNSFPYAFTGTTYQDQIGAGTNEFMVFQTDYANPISKNSKFELGARSSIRKLSNYSNITNPEKSSVTSYMNEDRVLAAYSTFSNRIGENFGYQLGLRAESSTNEGVLNDKDKFTTEFPISLFPSAFVSQKLSETSDIQLNYSRRINRPNFFQLFPFTDYASDQLVISRGNPGLQPEFTNSLEFSFSTQFKNRDNFIASVYYKNTNDLITRFQTGPEYDTFLKREVLVNTYVNANSQYVTGLELTSRNSLVKWWELTTNANFFTSKIDLENAKDPDQFLSYFFKINNTFRLPKNLTLQLSGDYQSRTVSAPGGGGGGRGGGMHGGGGGSASQGYNRPNYGVDAALRFEFLKTKTASVSLNVNDIFATKKFSSYAEGFDQNGNLVFIQDSERFRDPQVVRLNFNLRFGKFDATLFKRKNTREEPVDSGMGMRP